MTGLDGYCPLVAQDVRTVNVFYSVLPPDPNAGQVLRWFQNR
jgi:hypothetical protein